jgi:hypothetical protein
MSDLRPNPLASASESVERLPRDAIAEPDPVVRREALRFQTRRYFLAGGAAGLGAIALQALSGGGGGARAEAASGGPPLELVRDPAAPLSPLPPQIPAKAKRVIYLHMEGAPSQYELFEHKPELAKFDGADCPQSFLEGKRFAFLTGVPKLMGPQYPLHQTGQSGAWVSDRLPNLETQMDRLCFIRSMRTDQFNHAPALLAMHTGNARLGSASMGAWVTYGLGTDNQNLPGYIVLLSGGAVGDKQLWGSGYLPSVYQGVQCRSDGEPVLFLENPKGVSRTERRRMLDAIDELNREAHARVGNPETITRIAQYEMAYRMQVEATDAMDIGREPEAVRSRYGATPGQTSFANNCLLARRLAERGVRFIQLFHADWDSHGSNARNSLNLGFPERCREIDQPITALLEDLAARGLLEDTLVVWGGEFGRTPMRENRGGKEMKFVGRDHNPFAFTIWVAGGGVKPGFSYGETDEMGYEVANDPVEVRDLHATLMHLLGFDHHKLTFAHQGLAQKLTGVKPARVVAEILA